MDARLDSPFEIWGGFRKVADGSSFVHGCLRYNPDQGISLDLVESLGGVQSLGLRQADEKSLRTIYGKLVDGTLVTLSDCFISRASIQIGIGIGSPTTLVVNRALFGRHVADIDQLRVKEYSAELSSLANWTCARPANMNWATAEGKTTGVDICCRIPPPIDVLLPNRPFDVKISHNMHTSDEACSMSVAWSAGVRILTHDGLALETVNEIAWQCQNLMSLLIGERLSVRQIAVIAAHPSSVQAPALKLVYHQRGRHDHKDLYPPEMLLPYSLVKDTFPTMVKKWFERSEQAVLATNIFFGSRDLRSTTVDVRFMAAAQAAESYHRSLGTGLYMDQAAYDAAIEELTQHIPATIQEDHRQSLKNRLKYGNEYSLRKRLTQLFSRVPEDTRRRIAGDADRFVAKVVDTRNYLAHYDRSLQAHAFEGKDMYAAAERLRILITANLLHDLGIKDADLVAVLKRSREFAHWLSEPLAL